LITVPLSIKYISILAPLLAKYDLYVAQILHYISSMLESRISTSGPEPRENGLELPMSKEHPDSEPMSVFVSGTTEYLTALRAMKEHWSQLVWFRWLNVMFSRYMWVNEWIEVKV
jgi:N-acetylglucosaminylphosphatidylinositol deacetylase